MLIKLRHNLAEWLAQKRTGLQTKL